MSGAGKEEKILGMFTFWQVKVLMSKQVNFLKETIMNMYNVKVNDTHMCVLRKVENEDRVKVDFVELKFKYQDQLDELKRMADNDNRSVLDMQDYVKGSSLRRLSFDFDFCSCLTLSGCHYQPSALVHQVDPGI